LFAKRCALLVATRNSRGGGFKVSGVWTSGGNELCVGRGQPVWSGRLRRNSLDPCRGHSATPFPSIRPTMPSPRAPQHQGWPRYLPILTPHPHRQHITLKPPKSTMKPGTHNVEEIRTFPAAQTRLRPRPVYCTRPRVRDKRERPSSSPDRERKREVGHEDIRGYFLQKAAR
jgi:hypothetical protein